MRSTLRSGGASWLPLLLVAAALLLGGILLGGCNMLPVPPTTPEATAAGAQGKSPTSAALPAGGDAAIRTAWEASKHANTFTVDDKGENNECARCHSPLNWTPISSADLLPQCTTCKFKVGKPKPVVQTEWKSIGCDTCHRVEDGVLTAQVAWLDSLIAQYETGSDPYEPVQSPTELCEKCHHDTGTQQFARNLGSGPHASFDCTKCHDPHSGKASCTTEGCHADALKPAKPIAGHDAAHAAVTCVACHDASGLQVGPGADKQWLPFRAVQSSGKAGTAPYVSHTLQRKVDCARCHYSGNPWNLKADKS